MLAAQRYTILGVLLVLAAGAWALLIWQTSAMSAQMMSLTMGLNAPLFLAIWITMMVAMMFPSAAPMILMYATITTQKRDRQQAFTPTWVFVGGYLLLWAAFGIVSYALASIADTLAMRSPWVMDSASRIGAALLILAGVYQFTPLKRVCLTKCRSPLQFVLTSWHDGVIGAARMGLTHGFFCLGCCWLLFMLLLPLGIMNIAIMALLTAVIFAEKALPAGERVSTVAGGALILYGVIALAVPAALPVML